MRLKNHIKVRIQFKSQISNDVYEKWSEYIELKLFLIKNEKNAPITFTLIILATQKLKRIVHCASVERL